MAKITKSDLDSIQYFWENKGSITRWSGWDDVKEDVQREYPRIIYAWEEYLRAMKQLDSVIEESIIECKSDEES